ncbi:MAG: NCS2 family permease [Candidatus Cryptobacteroides sp.]|nr:NCS2 family permease [Bacteroidales bacterium]
MAPFLQKLFGFDPQKNSVRTEVLAGITTFLTMAYILAVNPSIFSNIADMPNGAVFTATALAAIIGTLVMSLYAKKPFGLAPGMGLNAFFVFTVCLGMGYSWQFALTAIFIEGVIFIILSLTKVRELIVNSIPASLKKAIGAGIGLYIAFIGLQNAGIIANDDATLVTLGSLKSANSLLFIAGLLVTAVLVALKVRGGILIGMLVTTLVGIPLGITQLSAVVALPDSVAPLFVKFEWSSIFSLDMLVVVLTFLFIDMFDTIGTLVGVSVKSGMVDKDGKIEGIDRMLMADAVATTAGACIGASTTTTYIESASGVAEGGRTGLTSFVIALCFAVALLFSPLFLAIPSAATGAVLVVVGVMMMSPVRDIDWDNYREAIPAFITAVMMPLSYSIAHGIMLGVITYVILNCVTGKWKEVSLTMKILAVLFVLRYALM